MIIFFIYLFVPFNAQASDLRFEVATSPLQVKQTNYILPDLSTYNSIEIENKIEAARLGNKNRVLRSNLLGQVEVRWLYAGEGFEQFAKMQNNIPKSLTVTEGVIDIISLHKKHPKYLIKQDDGSYLSKLPIVVSIGATLIINDITLKLSEESGSFISNGGNLYLSHAKLKGWRDTSNSPATYQEKENFRPFIVNWGASELYISNSKVSHLGYESPKTFGITLSGYKVNSEESMFQRENFDFTELPKTWIINSEFSDMYYGFYCEGANSVVIKGSNYEYNIVNAISTKNVENEFFISENNISNTIEKHGIIISNNSSFSYVINNNSFDNHRSGLVLDDTSSNSIIVNNKLYRNGGDGVSVYESDSNIIKDNTIYNNISHGVRVRNSQYITLKDNYIMSNKKFGVYFDAKETQPLDEYASNTSVENYSKSSGYIYGGVIANNRSGSLYSKSSEFISLYNLKLEGNGVNSYRLGFGGDIELFHNQIVKAMLVNKEVASLYQVNKEE